MGRFAQRYLADLRRRLLRHLHGLDLDYFSREPAGRVVARLTSDVESLQQFLQNGLSLLVRGILLVTLACAVMFTQSWQLTLAVLAVLPVLARREPLVPAPRVRRATRVPRVDGEPAQPRQRGARRHAGRAGVRHRAATARNVRRHQRRRVRRAHRERPDHVAVLRGHRVPAPGRADDRHRVRRGARGSRQDRGRHAHRVHAVPHAALRTHPAVHRAEHPDAGGERRVHADVRVPRTWSVARRRTRCRSVPARARRSADRGRDVPLRARRRSRGRRPRPDGARRANASRWSARAAPGKSTLAKLVGRFYDPTEGRVLIDGQDLRTVQSASLRHHVVVVPQEGFLFDGTIIDNIALGRPDADPGRDRGGRRRARIRRRARAHPGRSRRARREPRPDAVVRPTPAGRARPARSSPIRPSSSSTRRRRTSTRPPTRSSSTPSRACSTRGPRS